MIGSWNGVVAPDDTVYNLGDFAMPPPLVAAILPQLNDKKLLIAGNHDRCHPKIGRPSKWLQAYLDAGFDSVEIEVQKEIAGAMVLLHPFPYRAETEPKQKYYGQRPVDCGGWLIHGHVHNRWKVSGRQINVSVENWNFEPVGLETIAAIIKTGPQLAAETRSYD